MTNIENLTQEVHTPPEQSVLEQEIYAPPQYSEPAQVACVPLKHSGIGIASFVISIFMGIFYFSVILIAGVVGAANPEGINEESVTAVVIGLLILAGLGVSLIGIGLGIAGVIQKEYKKILSVLGLVFNSLGVIGVIGLMIIGILAS